MKLGTKTMGKEEPKELSRAEVRAAFKEFTDELREATEGSDLTDAILNFQGKLGL